MIDYALILSRRYQGKQWTLNGDAYAGLTWLSDSPKPSKATLDGLWSEVQSEIAAETADKTAARQVVLDRLGITADEAKLILGA